MHYRSPKAANVPFHGHVNILDGHKTRTKQFFKDTRFQYGSIYQNPSQVAPSVGPSSYKNRTDASKTCSVTYKPCYIEMVTGCPQEHFEFVNGLRVLQVRNLTSKDQSQFSHGLGNTMSPHIMRSQVFSKRSPSTQNLSSTRRSLPFNEGTHSAKRLAKYSNGISSTERFSMPQQRSSALDEP